MNSIDQPRRCLERLLRVVSTCGLPALLLPCLLLVPAIARSLPADRQAVAHLEAGQVELDEQKGLSIYRGAVHYRQGTLNLWADELIVHSRDGRIVRVVATGQPARLRQRLEGDKEDARAEARTIEYDLVDGRLVLRGSSHMWREDDEFMGETITYDEANNTVKAQGAGEEHRVQVIIHPKGRP